MLLYLQVSWDPMRTLPQREQTIPYMTEEMGGNLDSLEKKGVGVQFKVVNYFPNDSKISH